MPSPYELLRSRKLIRLELTTRSLALRIYDLVVDGLVIGLIFAMLAVLIAAFVDVVSSVLALFPSMRAGAIDEHEFRTLVASVLDVFVVIELFSTFTGYVRTRHIRLSGLLDVTIVFTLREILVKLYAQSFAISDLIGLCIIAAILVIARSIAARFAPTVPSAGEHGPGT